MEDLLLIRSPDDILLYLKSPATQGILESDERAARIVELSELAYVAKERGDLETALQYEREAYRLCLQLQDASKEDRFLSLVAAKCYNIGQLYYQMGKPEEAKRHFEQARKLDADAGNLVGQAASIRSLGFLQQNAGNFPSALGLHNKALQLDYKAGFEYGIAVDQANIGAIYLKLGDFQQALRYLGQALSFLEASGQVQEAEKVRQLVQTAESQLI